MFHVAMRDQAAFKRLYDATARCLLGIVVRMLHDRDWAEEVLQEVYVSVWNVAPSYSAVKSKPMTWLVVAAVSGDQALKDAAARNRTQTCRATAGDKRR